MVRPLKKRQGKGKRPSPPKPLSIYQWSEKEAKQIKNGAHTGRRFLFSIPSAQIHTYHITRKSSLGQALERSGLTRDPRRARQLSGDLYHRTDHRHTGNNIAYLALKISAVSLLSMIIIGFNKHGITAFSKRTLFKR